MTGPGESVDGVTGHCARLGAVESVRRGDDDDEWNITLTEFLGEKFLYPGRFGVRILESAGGELLCHRYSEGPDAHHQQHRDNDDPSRCGDGHSGDTAKHVISLARTQTVAV